MADKKNNIINDKTKALEKESNITLVSTVVAICSFFVLFYVQNLLTVDFMRAQGVLLFIEILYTVVGVAALVAGIVRKQKYFFEYTAFFLIMAVGYYLLKNGAAGIPGLVRESGNSFTISPFAMTVSRILQSKYIILGLWAVNVLYGIFTITLHTVKYTKIKNGRKNS